MGMPQTKLLPPIPQQANDIGQMGNRPAFPVH